MGLRKTASKTGEPNAAAEPGPRIREWIDRLGLKSHPEGGWYRETFRSRVEWPREALPDGYPADRIAMTSILFLLPTGVRSRWHRVRSEELWMHHRGDDLRLGIATVPNASRDEVREIRLGQGASSVFQAVVPAAGWQEAEALPGDAGFALVGCVVAPGFEFEDFEMAEDDEPSA